MENKIISKDLKIDLDLTKVINIPNVYVKDKDTLTVEFEVKDEDN